MSEGTRTIDAARGGTDLLRREIGSSASTVKSIAGVFDTVLRESVAASEAAGEEARAGREAADPFAGPRKPDPRFGRDAPASRREAPPAETPAPREALPETEPLPEPDGQLVRVERVLRETLERVKEAVAAETAEAAPLDAETADRIRDLIGMLKEFLTSRLTGQGAALVGELVAQMEQVLGGEEASAEGGEKAAAGNPAAASALAGPMQILLDLFKAILGLQGGIAGEGAVPESVLFGGVELPDLATPLSGMGETPAPAEGGKETPAVPRLVIEVEGGAVPPPVPNAGSPGQANAAALAAAAGPVVAVSIVSAEGMPLPVEIQSNGTPQVAAADSAGTSTGRQIGMPAGRAEAAPGNVRSEQAELIGRLVRMARLTLKQSGEGQMRMRLFPPQLGNLKVDLSVKDGVLNGQLVAETAAARQVLTHNLDHLKAALAAQGLTVGDLSVSVDPHGRPWGTQSDGTGDRSDGRRGDAGAGEKDSPAGRARGEGAPTPLRWRLTVLDTVA